MGLAQAKWDLFVIWARRRKLLSGCWLEEPDPGLRPTPFGRNFWIPVHSSPANRSAPHSLGGETPSDLVSSLWYASFVSISFHFSRYTLGKGLR